MPIDSLSSLRHLSQSFTYVEATNANGKLQFIHDDNTRIAYRLLETGNTTNSPLTLCKTSKDDIKSLGVMSVNTIINCCPAELLKSPDLTTTILGQFSTHHSIPNRFRAIDALSQEEKINYKQLSSAAQTHTLRCSLISLIDDDLTGQFGSILKEWEKYGVSASEVDPTDYAQFKTFYDEIMEKHAIIKEDYSKVDFTAQNIKSAITDTRCLNAKLTPFQIFKAAFQLGDIPGLTNFRFMDNPASKDDGKYREWMFHFDNSNYAAEFKIITTRKTGTLIANKEQCLAAFPYDTSHSIRFTTAEIATKFPTFEALEDEISDVQDASYVVIKNPRNNTPIETGIRTEMIAHHRSGSNKEGLDQGECRSAELMTFHGIGRCQPFLSSQELDSALTLSALQRFVLGDFRNSEPGKFMDCMEAEKKSINSQLRILISKNSVLPLEALTVAKFSHAGTVVLDEALFNKQMNTYEALPEVIDQIPRLIQGGDELKNIVLQMVPMLMNFDQNAELRPDCAENKAFPARTQIRERTKKDFCAPLERDLQYVQFNIHPRHLLRMDEIICIAKDISEFYRHCSGLLKERYPHTLFQLFESRAELSKEYTHQLPMRASFPETHQTLALFIYYMIDDLDTVALSLRTHNIVTSLQQMNEIKRERLRILQHFITHRMLNDSLPR